VTDVYVNDRVFKCFDVDESGHVDFKEFCLGLTAAWEATLADKMVTYFNVIDKDGDGMLEREEIEELLLDSHQWDDGDMAQTIAQVKLHVNLIFDLIDPKAKGGISKDRFLDGLVEEPQVVAILDRCFGTTLGTTESAPKADTGGEQEGKEGDEALCRLKPKQEGRSLDEIKKRGWNRNRNRRKWQADDRSSTERAVVRLTVK